jgi:sterol desaturase/sphingolipid hydroxylase (fatty acid hydroxylase superfamily)
VSKYLDTFINAYSGYWNYLTGEILHPSWHNYFYWLIALSLIVWLLEIIVPWRKNQGVFRRDFWLDGFYMFFNFFLFSLVIFNGVSMVAVELFNDFLGLFGITNTVAISVQSWPLVLRFGLAFILADFIQWNVHRTLHRVPWMWEFHKVHHSVKEMGFAAHLRFHWMESVIYKTIQYIPLAMIGFGIEDYFIMHIFAVAVGHLNHANLGWDYGPLKYIFNNPRMHIWHHAKELPADHKYGVNYGLTFSFWDYIFGSAYVPTDGRDIELGFAGEESLPDDFIGQVTYPLSRKS